MSTVVDEQVVARPAAPLRGLVQHHSGWRQRGVPPTRHHGLPSPWLTVIVTLDDPLSVVAHPDPAQPPEEFDALVGGLHTVPTLVAHGGRQSGVQLAVHPLAARRLLGVPAGDLAGRDLHADDVLGPLAGEVQDRLREAPSWRARFALLDTALLDAAVLRDGCRPPDRELVHAWSLLRAGRGTVAEVAGAVGWSPRRLSARFAAEVGLSPQETARVARFDRARRELQARPGCGLAGLAARHGWYDQAHMTRDFTRFAGLSPTRWLALEGRSVQDTADAVAAGSSS